MDGKGNDLNLLNYRFKGNVLIQLKDLNTLLATINPIRDIFKAANLQGLVNSLKITMEAKRELNATVNKKC
ncbi:hypothetical protein [Bacillus cereus]|uniref:hypothetical protein n=1 Tax=Bacillus cereus TaxID=1396 RepID=UPI00211D2C18|nr:hypothetical protein [Bacillus cereus]